VLVQAEAERLLAVEKHRVDDSTYSYPGPGVELRVPLLSADRREEFVLDIRRHRIEVVHGGKFQARARSTIPLARVCFARPHRNPDDAEVPRTHIHIYREGFDLRWAFPLEPSRFPDPEDRFQLLVDFMRYVCITREPIFQRDAFV
jgi:hypothetical protein